MVKARQGARSVGMSVAGDRSALDRAIADPYPELNRVVREIADGSDLRRKGTRDLWFDGHRTPAGRLLLYSPYVTHRLPELWPEHSNSGQHLGYREIRLERGEGLKSLDSPSRCRSRRSRSPKAWRRPREAGCCRGAPSASAPGPARSND